MNEVSKIVLLTTIIVSSLIEFYLIIKVSFSDPGIVIRGDLSEREFEKYVPIAVIHNKNYILKYCSTCEITKDLRVFHCSSCDACIARHDHHCPWLSICIGGLNHKIFITLIVFSVLHTLMIMAVEVIISNKIINSEDEILFKMLPIVLIGFASLVLTFLFLLLFFQIKNICLNSTTSEELRKETVPIPDFSFGTAEKNCTSFQNEIFSYKSLVNYNKDSQYLLGKNKMLVEIYHNHKKTALNSSEKTDNDSKFELEYKSNLSTSTDI